MLVIIDNYDSFTYNVAQYFIELGAHVRVIKNDQMTVHDAMHLGASHLVISPGPCTPDQAGISLALIEKLAGKIPILGICLGLQVIAQALGGRIVHANSIVHGKTSPVFHLGKGVFDHLPSPMNATRYHSLAVDHRYLPGDLEMTAWTQNAEGEFDQVMGLKHKTLPIQGVQFHPESVLSEHGHTLFNNFLLGK